MILVELSRNRNFFYFIRNSYQSDTHDLLNFEEFYWKNRTRNKYVYLKTQYQEFLSNRRNEVDDSFAYEGIFDK